MEFEKDPEGLATLVVEVRNLCPELGQLADDDLMKVIAMVVETTVEQVGSVENLIQQSGGITPPGVAVMLAAGALPAVFRELYQPATARYQLPGAGAPIGAYIARRIKQAAGLLGQSE